MSFSFSLNVSCTVIFANRAICGWHFQFTLINGARCYCGMDVWRSDGDDDDDGGGGCSTKWIHPKRDYLILLLNYRYENGGSVFVIIAGRKSFPNSRTSYRMNEWMNEFWKSFSNIFALKQTKESINFRPNSQNKCCTDTFI